MVTFNKQTFNGKEYDVYDNANFSIIVDRYCNAACTFCVEDLRNQSKLKKALRYNQFIPNVEKALTKMRALNTSISLTGGEPTASAAFVDLVKLIDKYDFRKKVVTTNGSYLTARNFKILDTLIDANWDHLNISKTHYDESVNNKLMRYKTGYFSNDMLKQVVNHIKERGSKLRIRLSCVLTKETVKSLDDIKKYADTYIACGVDNMVFRELMKTDVDSITNSDRKSFYETSYVDMTPILSEIASDPEFKLINTVNGYYYNVWVYNYKGADLCFEQADLRKMPEKEDNEIYEFVLHESGKLCGSWDDSDECLLNILEDENEQV